MLDADLAVLYGVPTKRLAEQVRRNSRRFPADFMFRLTAVEARILRSRIAASSFGRGWGGRRYAPYAFTEQGVASSPASSEARVPSRSISPSMPFDNSCRHQPPGAARSAFAHGPAGTTWADYGLNRTGDHNLTEDHSGVEPRAFKSGRGRQVNIAPVSTRHFTSIGDAFPRGFAARTRQLNVLIGGSCSPGDEREVASKASAKPSHRRSAATSRLL